MHKTIKKFNRHAIIVVLYSFLFVSCLDYQESDRIDIKPEDIEYYSTKATESANPFLVSAEMVRTFIESNQRNNKQIVSINPYPSAELPCVYIVNYDEGWAVFPADARFGIVLMESTQGSLDLAKGTGNIGFDLWLEDINNQIEFARELKDESFGKESSMIWDLFRPNSCVAQIGMRNINSETKSEILDINDGYTWAKVLVSSETVTDTIAAKGHLLQTKWGQSYPWNSSMYLSDEGKCITGCAAVAISQVLYYYHNLINLPTGLYHGITISSALQHTGGFYSLTLDRLNYVYNSSRWSEMPLHRIGGTNIGYKYVSDLMLDVGVRLGMLYSPTLSGVPVTSYNYFDIAPCNLTCLWKPFSSNSDIDIVIHNIEDQNSPIIMTATDPGIGTHTWVIDGYKTIQTYTSTIYAWYPVELLPSGVTAIEYMNVFDLLELHPDLMIGLQETSNTYPLTNKCFLMNWGVDGAYDDVLYSANPSLVWSLDIYGFSSSKAMYYHFIPDELEILAAS